MQVLLHNFLLLKMFMAAVISGTLAVSLIDALSSAGERKRRMEKPTINIEVTPSKREIRQALFKNYDGNVIGGILLGAKTRTRTRTQHHVHHSHARKHEQED